MALLSFAMEPSVDTRRTHNVCDSVNISTRFESFVSFYLSIRRKLEQNAIQSAETRVVLLIKCQKLLSNQSSAAELVNTFFNCLLLILVSQKVYTSRHALNTWLPPMASYCTISHQNGEQYGEVAPADITWIPERNFIWKYRSLWKPAERKALTRKELVALSLTRCRKAKSSKTIRSYCCKHDAHRAYCWASSPLVLVERVPNEENSDISRTLRGMREIRSSSK